MCVHVQMEHQHKYCCTHTHLLSLYRKSPSFAVSGKSTKIKRLTSFLFIELWSSELCPGGHVLGVWRSCPECHFLNINNKFYTGLSENASSSQITGRTTSPAASPLATVRILHQASNDLFASVTFSSRSIS